eukprot:jgi/Tetstr1/466361/TSEL_010891.t1
MCIICSAGSGKTSLAVNLLTSKQAYKRAFHHVHMVMPPRSVESLKRNVFKSHDKMYPELDYGTLDTIKGRVMESAEKKNTSVGATAKGIGNLAGVAEDALKGRGVDIGAARDGFDQVYDPEMVTEVIKLYSEVAMVISQANRAGYRIPMTGFQNHSSSVEKDASSVNTVVSTSARSLKTLLTVFRPHAIIGDGTKNNLSPRANPFGNVGRWSYACDGILYPQRPVDSYAEAYMELQKAFHALGALDHGVIAEKTWIAAEGTYIVAHDLELLHRKSSVSENGIDMSTSLIYLRAQFSTGLGAAQRIDAFTHIDAVLFIDPTGMAQTVF